MPIFTDVLQNKKTGIDKPGINKPGSIDARDWYREKAREVRVVNPNKIINNNKQYNRNNIMPGFLYLFGYNPKTKEDLPYYDRFPLVFPFKKEQDGFLGMNLHYLPHIMRARLMDNLYALVNNNKFDETTKLKASYNLLNSAARYKYFKPCIKKYLNSHVTSRFLMIPSDEWDIALFLPLERFEKQTKNSVFRESRKIINGL